MFKVVGTANVGFPVSDLIRSLLIESLTYPLPYVNRFQDYASTWARIIKVLQFLDFSENQLGPQSRTS